MTPEERESIEALYASGVDLGCAWASPMAALLAEFDTLAPLRDLVLDAYAGPDAAIGAARERSICLTVLAELIDSCQSHGARFLCEAGTLAAERARDALFKDFALNLRLRGPTLPPQAPDILAAEVERLREQAAAREATMKGMEAEIKRLEDVIEKDMSYRAEFN